MHRHITEAVWLGVLFIGGRKRRPEEIFKFRVSEMPFPGLWGSFDRMRTEFTSTEFTSFLFK